MFIASTLSVRISRYTVQIIVYIDQHGSTFDHYSGTVTRAKASAFTAKCNQTFAMTVFGSDAQDTLFQPTTLEIILEFQLHIPG